MCETEVIEDVNVAPAAAVMEYTTTTSGNHTSKNANGNIITLTLKNNQLIVETEERAVRTTLQENFRPIVAATKRLHKSLPFLSTFILS